MGYNDDPLSKLTQVNVLKFAGSEEKAEVLADNHSWWYAKRFLHPDVVAAYEYIFIWDEDLGAEHFNGEK
ncbi:hypothetical protein Pint_02603 [Pistacia integerrima]|uniref:Uncharacterized protein n=1 Tax=Pistacia integerrima TaxID=434235 RepID=A0ACC0ZM14_9ROSI|nr:hypothetical protein Pint_02603 [Pistacia integerrima]